MCLAHVARMHLRRYEASPENHSVSLRTAEYLIESLYVCVYLDINDVQTETAP